MIAVLSGCCAGGIGVAVFLLLGGGLPGLLCGVALGTAALTASTGWW